MMTRSPVTTYTYTSSERLSTYLFSRCNQYMLDRSLGSAGHTTSRNISNRARTQMKEMPSAVMPADVLAAIFALLCTEDR